MAETERLICARESLTDGGRASRFVIELDGRRLSAFVVAFDGGIHADINSCPHRGTELDWHAGEVFDESGRYLVCATHGALFEPDTGRCVGGPCQGARLTKIAVDAQDEGVFLRTARLIT